MTLKWLAAGFARIVFVTTAALMIFGVHTSAAALTNTILFVTQVPQPTEVNDNTVTNVFLGIGAGFGNHLSDTLHAPRGGDLWLRKSNGTLTNLTRGLGFGLAGTQHGGGIAVRDPLVNWDGARALFSMVAGAPASATDTNRFFWQLYEITGLPNGPYAITAISGQPTNYNNVSPCYMPDGRIVFASDRPRDGSPHLYPQLDEYNEFPTVTGLWSLDPATGDFHLINHTPSGVFSPSVDSFGRLIFVRWDHLVQDRNATDDRLNIATNGTFNFTDESANSTFNLGDRAEFFPEPRNFDPTNLAALGVNGNALNSFFPWSVFPDGSGEEILNHMGRHDLMSSFKRSFTNDPNLVDFAITNRPLSTNFLSSANYFWMREDSRTNGVYYGIDAPDFGMHAAGEIVTITAPLGLDADHCFITYVTPKSTAGVNAYGVYRNPLPLSDGVLVAAFTTNANAADSNIGTFTLPQPRFHFRLYSLTNIGGVWFTNVPLTTGLSNSASGSVVQYVNGQLVTNTGALWELYPVEVVASKVPPTLTNVINGTEQQVFDEEGVDVALFQDYLRVNNLALVVSHDVTKRDRADKQQPYNLRIAGTATVTTNNSGKIYDIAHMQFIQADQRRGFTANTGVIQPGRRVLPTPLHDLAADNVVDLTGPPGSLKLGNDGSVAALVPARRAITWQLMGTNAVDMTNSIVKERFWVTFQPGEIRTCKNCHGINTADQTGALGGPNNEPQALHDLLRYWKTNNTSVVGITTNGGENYLSLKFKRRIGVSNITHTVQVSPDLLNWTNASVYSATGSVPNTALTSEVSRGGTNNETIVIRENAPINSAPQQFMRVLVTSP
ncbi:MAG TPA: hypothetical protein VNN22_08865 [Verrucomicrobiae bacterium]|nr:hypothetical protein [Verrucomicrobiae bacterium]